MSNRDEYKNKSSIVPLDGFPGNSHTEKAAKKEKKVDKVVSGPVSRKKRPMGRRVADTLTHEDADKDSVSRYIIYDVLIPAAKTTISEMVSGGVEMLLFGDTRGSRTNRRRDKSYVSYNSVSRNNDRPGRPNRAVSYENRSRHNFDDVIIPSRGEAEEVLSALVDLIEEYGAATVADFYDLVGVTGSFTDEKYGWTELGRASVSRVRHGYLINLPKTRVVD